MPAMEKANVVIRQFLSGYPQTSFVDVYQSMLDSNGKPRKELFLDDQLHMNKKVTTFGAMRCCRN